MSRIRANTIVNGAGTGAPNFPRGAITSGISVINAEISVGTGTSISSPATNELALGTNNLERLRITSAGSVGIGTDNPTAKLEVETSVDGESTLATFKNTSGGGTNETVDIKLGLENTIASNVILRAGKEANHNSGAATDNFFAIHTTENNTSAEKLRITSAGEVQIANGNLKFSTAGTGIDFSATSDGSGTATSELLDDYEEGTWSPAIIKVLSNPSVSYSVREGTYTKVGRIVTVFFDVVAASITGGSGAARIGDLPFTVSSSMAGFSRIHFRDSSAVSPGGATDQLTGYAQKENTFLALQKDSSGASGYGYNAAADWNSSGRVTGYVTYEV